MEKHWTDEAMEKLAADDAAASKKAQAQAEMYVNAIWNDHKRAYAKAYLAHMLTKGSATPEAVGIGAMAAQAVRMNLAEILGDIRI